MCGACMAKQMRKERKDVIGTKYVKDELGNIKVEEADIMQRWKRYFHELLNDILFILFILTPAPIGAPTRGWPRQKSFHLSLS